MKQLLGFLLMGLLGVLIACSPQPTVGEAAPPAESVEVRNAETAPVTAVELAAETTEAAAEPVAAAQAEGAPLAQAANPAGAQTGLQFLNAYADW